MNSLEACEAHPNLFVSFICTQKSCNQFLCPECIFQHCKDHETKKTYPEIKSIETVKDELSHKIGGILKTLYQELEDLNISQSEKVLKDLDNAQDEIISVVQKFFKKKKEDALDELKKLKQESNVETVHTELKSTLQNKVFGYEELSSEIHSSQNNVRSLQKLAERDFGKELKEIVEEINIQIRPIQLWRSEHREDNILKVLNSLFIVGKLTNQLMIPPDKKDADIEIIPGEHIVMRKKMQVNHPSVCLGPCLDKGVHKMTVKIDVLESNPYGGLQGWVGIGFIENPNINLAQSNYSQAACICSDQSFYKVHVSQSGQVAAGVTYVFQIDFGTGELLITGDNGLECKGTGYQGKSMYPYFEFTNKHQITILNYMHTA